MVVKNSQETNTNKRHTRVGVPIIYRFLCQKVRTPPPHQ